jgi:uncharacterized membrane protein YccC
VTVEGEGRVKPLSSQIYGFISNWFEGAFALRLCVAALLAFTLANVLGLGHGYSAALSAIILIRPYQQGAIRAGLFRLVATLGGLVAAEGVGMLRHTGLNDYSLLTLVMAPLSLLAAYDASWRTSMISALLLLGIPGDHNAELKVSLGRTMIVGLGAVVGVGVSVLIAPRPHTHVIHERCLKLAGDLLRALQIDLGEDRTKALRDKTDQKVRRKLLELAQMIRETRKSDGTEDAAASSAGLVRHIQALCLLLRSQWRRADLTPEQKQSRITYLQLMGAGLKGDEGERVRAWFAAEPESPVEAERWLLSQLARDVSVLRKREA